MQEYYRIGPIYGRNYWNAIKKKLFQFLQDDVLDNNNNYLSENVGYGSAIKKADSDAFGVFEDFSQF